MIFLTDVHTKQSQHHPSHRTSSLEVKRRNYARRTINPCLDFKQNISETYNCGREQETQQSLLAHIPHLSLNIFEGAKQGQRLYSSAEGFWPELITAEAYEGFAPTLQPPNPQSSSSSDQLPQNVHPTLVSQQDATGTADRSPHITWPVLPRALLSSSCSLVLVTAALGLCYQVTI